MLGLVTHGGARILVQRAVCAGDRIDRALTQMRAVLNAVVGQHGRGMRQLQHGEVVVALANPQRDGLARIPLLLLRTLVGIAFPFGAGQHAAGFAHQINAGLLPKTHGREVFVDGVHAHVIGQHVVVHVGGFDDGAAQVGRSVRVTRTEGVPTKGPAAIVLNGGIHLALARLQTCNRHERLIGRTRWVGATQSPVEQRAVDRVVEEIPVFLVNTVHKQVHVVARLADHGQHFTVTGVQGHQRTTAIAIHIFHQLLQANVQAQHHGIARSGGPAVQAAYCKATGCGFQLLPARQAMQLLFVTLLNAQLANYFRTPVVGIVLAVFQRLLLALIDTADIAHHVPTDIFERVVAEKTGLDVHARKAPALRRKARYLFIRQPAAQGNRFKALGVLHETLEFAAVTRCDLYQLAQSFDGFFQILDLRACDLQRIGRVVGGQHHAIAVQNFSAIGHNRHHRSAVAFGTLCKRVMAHHLQDRQAKQQNTQQR